MRKLAFFVMMFVALGVQAQNVQLHYDMGKDRGYATSTIEMFKPDKWGNTFFFVDMNYGDREVDLSYFEFAREFKMGNTPVNAHIEYNGGLTNMYSFGNAVLAGLSWSKNAEDFSKGITFIGMYKHIDKTFDDKPHSFQLTAVWYMNFAEGKFTFSGFADFWKQNIFGDYIFLTEPQFWYNANENLSLGGEIEFSNNFVEKGFTVMPTLAVKWNFK